MVTMQDVARVAGVSAMTVSNVLNNRVGATADTRARVMQVVSELGYQVNVSARQLRVGRTDTIALLVPTIEGAYFAELATHLTRAAASRGLRVVVETTGVSAQSEFAALRSAMQGSYDGLVFSPMRLGSADLESLTVPGPVVFLGERELPAGFDHIMMDNVGGTSIATARLIELGARHIALIGGETEDPAPGMATLRTSGYRIALEAEDLAFDSRLVIPNRTYGMDEGYEAVRSLAARSIDFDAIIALTDTAAIGAVRALTDLGRSIPQDVQVIGFDNIPETEFLVPRLSSIDPGTPIIAETVLEMLLARTANPERAPRTATPARARLVERETTRAAAPPRRGSPT